MSKTLGKQLAEAVVFAAIPIAVAMMIQRPDLRQALVMRSAHYARAFCQAQADFWQTMAITAANAYNKARL
jgi:hypothetical protein